MSIIGPNAISVHTKVRLPARFATDNGVGKEITVQTGNPGPRQTWFVKHLDKPDIYTITAGPFPLIDAPGFRRESGRGPQDVLNAQFPGAWRITPVEGLVGVFQVRPDTISIDVDELLGTEGDKVVIQTFRIGIPNDEKPAWNFAPINSKSDV